MYLESFIKSMLKEWMRITEFERKWMVKSPFSSKVTIEFPFKEMENLGVVIHSSIQRTIVSGKPTIRRTVKRKSHRTVSKAFIRSTFSAQRGIPWGMWEFLISYVASQIFSPILRPRTKAVCCLGVERSIGNNLSNALYHSVKTRDRSIVPVRGRIGNQRNKINGNVFHARVENWIDTEMSSTNIVTHNDRRLLQRDTKFSEKWLNPNELGGGSGKSTILSFSRRAGKRPLFSGTRIFTEEKNESRGSRGSIPSPGSSPSDLSSWLQIRSTTGYK